MEILIQPLGKVENEVLLMLEKSLEEIFGIKCSISKDIMEIPEKSYDPSRNQYYSTQILSFMMNILKIDSNHIIGVTEVDLYIPRLNFVFGEAECPGNFAIISLYRLKSHNRELFLRRILKEAVHELGHTFGFSHCENHLCVMHFSNSIVETDIKGVRFCRDCLNKIKTTI
jgi:archaemetzincin